MGEIDTSQMGIVISSLWRNDAEKSLESRAEHLLAKKATRWVWVVGDSGDQTESMLRKIAKNSGKDVEVVRYDTGIEGEEPRIRLRRLSLTANAGFDRVRPDDVLWILHESDLQSPPDLAERFFRANKGVIAGWVTLGNEQGIFYDTWAYRYKGEMFSNFFPYSTCYDPHKMFRVDSVGSVFMFPAKYLQDGMRCYDFGVLEICRQLAFMDEEVWVDPTIRIVQPFELFVSRQHA